MSLVVIKISKAVKFLESLSDEVVAGSKSSQPGASEAALLEIIQRRLPIEEQARLANLRQQNEIGLITDTAYQELLRYIDRIEQQDADRAEALIKLAQIRQVDLTVLISEFLPTYHSAV